MDRVARHMLAAAGALLVPFAAATGGSAQRLAMPEHGFEVGQPFPSIALPSLEDGKLTSIDAFRGQKVVLHLFASW